MKPEKRRIPIWLIGVAALGLLLFAYPMGMLVFGIIRMYIEDASIKRPKVYEPVLETMAKYYQSDPELIPGSMNHGWFPEPLRSKERGVGMVLPQRGQVRIELGAGFHHYGYELRLNESRSDETTNYWEIYYASEGHREYLDASRIPKSAHFTEEQIADQITGVFDYLADAPKYGEVVERVMLFLRHGHLEKAIAYCQGWSENYTESALAQFTWAHLICRMGESTRATHQFADWVLEHESFPNLIYFALFNMREGQKQEALAAIRKALDVPFRQAPDATVDNYYLGHNAAVYAFQQREYALCLQLCESMLASPRKDPYWRAAIWKLEAAALVMQGKMDEAGEALGKGLVVASELGAEADGSKPEARFVEAVREGDRSFIEHFSNWKDADYALYSPYGTNGPTPDADGLPSPYPADWREHVGF